MESTRDGSITVVPGFGSIPSCSLPLYCSPVQQFSPSSRNSLLKRNLRQYSSTTSMPGDVLQVVATLRVRKLEFVATSLVPICNTALLVLFSKAVCDSSFLFNRSNTSTWIGGRLTSVRAVIRKRMRIMCAISLGH